MGYGPLGFGEEMLQGRSRSEDAVEGDCRYA